MHRRRCTTRTAVALAGATLLGAGMPTVAQADTVEREVVASDDTDDVTADCGEDAALVAATDISEVAYRVGDAPAHEGADRWAVKIRIAHGETLTGTEHQHRAVTKFTHDDDKYRLVSTLDSASLSVRGDDDTWTEVEPAWMAAKGGEGLLIVKFPVAALGDAFQMDDLRTKLVVPGTSIVDRATTDEGLPVYPPR